MEDINMCDCCKDIWNRENLIKFDFTNNHKLFICPDCLKEMTNGDMIKAMFPNAEYKHIKTMSGIDGMEVKGINGLYDNFGQWCARDIFFHDDWWNAPYERS